MEEQINWVLLLILYLAVYALDRTGAAVCIPGANSVVVFRGELCYSTRRYYAVVMAVVVVIVYRRKVRGRC